MNQVTIRYEYVNFLIKGKFSEGAVIYLELVRRGCSFPYTFLLV